MFLHYGVAHAQPIVLAGVSLVTFAAGILIGSWSRTTDEVAATEPSNHATDQ